jgi:hypothetical protein
VGPAGGKAAVAQPPRGVRARGAGEGRLGRHLGPKRGGGKRGELGRRGRLGRARPTAGGRGGGRLGRPGELGRALEGGELG